MSPAMPQALLGDAEQGMSKRGDVILMIFITSMNSSKSLMLFFDTFSTSGDHQAWQLVFDTAERHGRFGSI